MTPDYASPEQIRGLPVTTASDVYSLGVLLYELLTGRRPYQTNRVLGFQERERIICQQDPEKPSKVVTQPELHSGPPGAASQSISVEQISQMREGAPDKLRRRLAGDLDNIVLKAMRKEPQRRYASVDQFSEDIRRHLEGLPVLARKDTPGYRMSKFISRNKAAIAAVTLILFTMIVGTLTTMREARVAERRFQDVRKLANSVVFELHDAIQDLPGSTVARKLLVERALEYLDRLSQEVGSDRSLQLELAAAYQKVGDVQGNPGNANLGDAKAAIQSYRKALAIRKHVSSAAPKDWEAQAALAGSYAKLGAMLASTEAIDNLQKAASIYSDLARAHAPENEILEQLVNSMTIIGTMQKDTGDSAGAIRSYRKALEAQEELSRAEPSNKKVSRSLTSLYNRIGFALSDSGEAVAALENFEKGRVIREKLAAADPLNASLRRELWVSYNFTADVLGNPNLQNLGRPTEALDYYRKALAIAESLAVADSSNIRARRDIVLSLTRIADVLQITGDLPGALSNYRRALTLLEALQIANPLNDELGRDQGIGFDRLARALAVAGDNKGAQDYFNRALNLQRKLAEADPKSARAHQDWLSTVYNTGDFLMKTRNLEAAGEHFRRGRQEAEQLLAANQSNVEARRTLANFSDKLGDYYAALAADKRTPLDRQQSHMLEASGLYRKAIALVNEIQTLGKLTAKDKKLLQELTRKLSLSSTPTAATGKGLSPH
jgi:tetratricopeptide (TPR) repeat protein